MNLYEAISGIQYDRSRGIWAELIDGKFHPNSKARYGQLLFKNGGVLDDMIFFANGERCGDALSDWKGDFDLWDYEEQWQKIIELFEEPHDDPEQHCYWAGDKREVQEWAENITQYSDIQESVKKLVSDIVKEARDIYDEITDDEWIQTLIDDQNLQFEEV